MQNQQVIQQLMRKRMIHPRKEDYKKTATQSIGIRIPAELRAKMQQLIPNRFQTLTQIILQALTDFLEEKEGEHGTN